MPLDDADKTTIKELIAGAFSPATIGAAVKSHLDTLKIGETIAAEVAKLAPKKEEEVPAPKNGKDDPTAARIAAMEKQLGEQTAARLAAEDARKADARDTAVRDALGKAGVPADRIRHAMATLQADQVLTFTADGKPGWKGKDQFGVDAVLSPDEAAAKWAATADGKIFLPPTGANGTGEGTRQSHGVGGGAPLTLDALRGIPNLGASILASSA